MTEWSKEAIEALREGLSPFVDWEKDALLCAALDAACEYEGVFPTSYVTQTQREAYDRGRAEALEEAATYLDNLNRPEHAKLIRALKGEKPS